MHDRSTFMLLPVSQRDPKNVKRLRMYLTYIKLPETIRKCLMIYAQCMAIFLFICLYVLLVLTEFVILTFILHITLKNKSKKQKVPQADNWT